MTDFALRAPAAIMAIGATLLLILGDLWLPDRGPFFSFSAYAVPVAVALPFVLPSACFRRGRARHFLSAWLVIAASVVTLRAAWLFFWVYERRTSNVWWPIAAISISAVAASWATMFAVFRSRSASDPSDKGSSEGPVRGG